MMIKLLLACTTLFSSLCFAYEREIAITMDDLPLVASKMNTMNDRLLAMERFNQIVQAFRQYKVPVTGFVIAGAIKKGQWAFLQEFRHAGFMLGNHTYSHYNLDHQEGNEYIADIVRADKILAPIMTRPKYFRYPYLAEGNPATKQMVCNYLSAHHYVIAPVTIDSRDYNFNAVIYKIPLPLRENYMSVLKPLYVAYVWLQTLKAEQRTQEEGGGTKHILLLHANLLNSYALQDVLKLYKSNGYKFIDLAAALTDPAPLLTVPTAEEKRKIQLKKATLIGSPK